MPLDLSLKEYALGRIKRKKNFFRQYAFKKIIQSSFVLWLSPEPDMNRVLNQFLSAQKFQSKNVQKETLGEQDRNKNGRKLGCMMLTQCGQFCLDFAAVASYDGTGSCIFGSSVRVRWPRCALSFLSGTPHEAKEMLLNPTGL